MLLAVVVARVHILGSDRHDRLPPSVIIIEAQSALNDTLSKKKEIMEQSPAKKRKIFNGIGKVLAGSILGVGNALVAGGTIAAPNPATAYIAIISASGAVGSFFSAIGDFKGE